MKEIEINESTPDWKVARVGITMLLNDQVEESKSLFASRSPNSVHILSGICYSSFLSALMSLDSEKIDETLGMLKKVEEHCDNSKSWIKSLRSKLWTDDEKPKDPADNFYEKIILADSLVCQALLKFLQDDVTSYIKGGWTLRKAWKIYHQTYSQLIVICKNSQNNLAETNSDKSNNTSPLTSPADFNDQFINQNDNEKLMENIECSDSINNLSNDNQTNDPAFQPEVNNTERYDDESFKRKLYSFPSQTCPDIGTYSILNDNTFNGSIKSSKKDNNVIEELEISNNEAVARSHSANQIGKHVKTSNTEGTASSSIRKSMSLFSSLNSLGSTLYGATTSIIGFRRSYSYASLKTPSIDAATSERLMSAVCFGYGSLRLCVSLAPSWALRWIATLGFLGDRKLALRCLEQARTGDDMRAPLASVALLWYHTIVRPFFNNDGNPIDAGVRDAMYILDKEDEIFANSALFLYFKGRIERMKANIPAAIEAFKLSINHANQPDVKVLGLHEVGWCNMLLLDFNAAFECYSMLQVQSRWSKVFYAYLSIVCSGAAGKFDNLDKSIRHLKAHSQANGEKGSHIENFVYSRVKGFAEPTKYNVLHWKMYCYELLYLWNTLPACSLQNLKIIAEDCNPIRNDQVDSLEPMKGLGKLIYGATVITMADKPRSNGEVHTINDILQMEEAAESLRSCISITSQCKTFVHIPAFAQFELGALLLNNKDTKEEGKHLLREIISKYEGYDFESKLSVRAQSLLYRVNKLEKQSDS